MTTADDRARLERIRHDHLYDVDLGRWDDDETWLLRIAEDGLDARAFLDSEFCCCGIRLRGHFKAYVAARTTEEADR